jgi:hypothetical protein
MDHVGGATRAAPPEKAVLAAAQAAAAAGEMPGDAHGNAMTVLRNAIDSRRFG